MYTRKHIPRKCRVPRYEIQFAIFRLIYSIIPTTLGSIMKNYISNSTYTMSHAPNVPVHCMHGIIRNSTIARVDFEDDFPDNPSHVELGEGDGTVNIESLRLCAKFGTMQKESVTVREMEDVEHQAIVSDPRVMQYIRALL